VLPDLLRLVDEALETLLQDMDFGRSSWHVRVKAFFPAVTMPLRLAKQSAQVRSLRTM